MCGRLLTVTLRASRRPSVLDVVGESRGSRSWSLEPPPPALVGPRHAGRGTASVATAEAIPRDHGEQYRGRRARRRVPSDVSPFPGLPRRRARRRRGPGSRIIASSSSTATPAEHLVVAGALGGAARSAWRATRRRSPSSPRARPGGAGRRRPCRGRPHPGRRRWRRRRRPCRRASCRPGVVGRWWLPALVGRRPAVPVAVPHGPSPVLVAGGGLRRDLGEVVAWRLPGTNVGLSHLVTSWLVRSTAGSACFSLLIWAKPACTRLSGSGEYPYGPALDWPAQSEYVQEVGQRLALRGRHALVDAPVGMIMYEYDDSGYARGSGWV